MLCTPNGGEVTIYWKNVLDIGAANTIAMKREVVLCVTVYVIVPEFLAVTRGFGMHNHFVVRTRRATKHTISLHRK